MYTVVFQINFNLLYKMYFFLIIYCIIRVLYRGTPTFYFSIIYFIFILKIKFNYYFIDLKTQLDYNTLSNYIPIYQLTILTKILEKVIYTNKSSTSMPTIYLILRKSPSESYAVQKRLYRVYSHYSTTY